jgi:hypothetical protein
MVGELKCGEEQEQEELENQVVEPAFDDSDDADRYHTFCNEKTSMA